MTIINIASKKSIYIIPGSKSYTLRPEIYTPVDMDLLDSTGLYSIQRDLDALIVSDNNTALRQYLSNKTLQGAVSAESIQDLMAATLTNSVYDDEANTILVGGSGGSGGNGGFSFGGDWDATPTENTNLATFNELDNCTATSTQLTVINSADSFGATATSINNASNNLPGLFRVTVPDTSEGFFFVSIHNSNESNILSTVEDETATIRGILLEGGAPLTIVRDLQANSYAPLNTTINVGDVLKVTYHGSISEVRVVNETQGNAPLLISSDITGFSEGLEKLSICSQGAGTILNYDFQSAYPIYQTDITITYPSDLSKTYRVSAANANSVINGKLLKVNDFVDFITNEDDEVVDVVVSRLVSDSKIRDTISTALNDPTSSVYTQTQSLGGTAGLDTVVSSLNEAINDNPSDLTTSLDNFLAYLLGNNASLFYEALQTQVQDAVYAIIQDDLQNNGMIYEAIAQYVEDSTTGVNGHAAIQTAIEENLNNYADGIGVGANGQVYLDVYEAAQAAISNEIQSGGIIDTAIQAAVNP